jgi:hypothetical protein
MTTTLQQLQRLAAELDANEHRLPALRAEIEQACRDAHADGATIETIADLTRYSPAHVHDLVYRMNA